MNRSTFNKIDVTMNCVKIMNVYSVFDDYADRITTHVNRSFALSDGVVRLLYDSDEHILYVQRNGSNLNDKNLTTLAMNMIVLAYGTMYEKAIDNTAK